MAVIFIPPTEVHFDLDVREALAATCCMERDLPTLHEGREVYLLSVDLAFDKRQGRMRVHCSAQLERPPGHQ